MILRRPATPYIVCVVVACAALIGAAVRTAIARADEPAAREPEHATDASGWNEQGLALSTAGRYEEALEAFRKALSLAPDDPVVRQNVGLTRANWGVALLRLGKALEAERETRAAIEYVPDDPVVRLNLAECLDHRGYPDAAAKAVLDAAKRGPDVPSVQRKLGAVHYREGRLAEAVAAWDKAERLAPDKSIAERLERARSALALEQRLDHDLSSNFTIYFEMEKHAVLASLVLRELEEVHAVVQAELQAVARERLKVVLLSTEAFRESTGAHTWVAGLFDGQIRLPIKDAGDRRDELLRRARHEYVHAVLASLGRRAPSWLHEGLAQIHEGREPGEARRRVAAAAVKLPFDDLARSFAGKAEADRARVQYDTALAFTHWLREGELASGFRAAMQRLFQGETLEDAFGHSYDADLPTLYRRFIEALAPR
jgi:Flp pilus assembly protein TadD